MSWILIRKELLEHILSVRFSVSLILAFLFLLPSTYMTASDLGWLRRELGPRPGFEVHWSGARYRLHRDIPSLQVLAKGLDEAVTLSSTNASDGLPGFSFGCLFVHNPLRHFFSQLDFVFFISIIGSLMAFVFTYDAVSGERRRVTLRLVMIQPISRPSVLLSKFIGSYTSFLISILPAMVGVILILHLHPDVSFRESDWGSAAILFTLALIYLASLFMLGVLVSCITRNPRTTLTAPMALWVFLVLVVPNFSPFLADRMYPLRSVYEMQKQIADLEENVWQKARAKHRDLTQGGRWDDLSESERDAVTLIWNEATYALVKLHIGDIAQIRGEFFNALDRQAVVSQYLSLISPSVAFADLGCEFAGTGIKSDRSFRRAVFAYRQQYGAQLDRYVRETGDYEKLSKVDKSIAPAFEYQEPTHDQLIAAYFPNLLMLVLYPVIFFLGAQVAFLRSQL